MSKVVVRLVASALIAAVLIWWLASQGFEVIPSMSAITSTVSPWSLAIYAGLFSVFHFLRAWRWVFLLRPFAKVPVGTMMETAFTGFMAIQMMP